jgi:UbiD family decarboxylase
VPALAETVIEGTIGAEVSPYVHTSSFSDTYCPFVSQEPMFEVSAVTTRASPIYRHLQPTRFTDHHAICEFIVAPMLLHLLRGKGLEVHDVRVPLKSCINAAFVRMTPRARAEARDAVHTGMSLPFFPRLTVAVDEDVDIHDTEDVLYALANRVDPVRDILTLEDSRGIDLDPLAAVIPGLEHTHLRSANRFGIDATRPPVTRPRERVYFERLRARGAGRVRLEDFLD